MYKRVFQIIGSENRKLLFHTIFMSLVASVMAAFTVLMIKEVPRYAGLGISESYTMIAVFALVLVTFSVARFSAIMGAVKVSERVMERTRVNICNQIRQTSLRQLETAIDMDEVYVVISRGSRDNQKGARAAVHTLQAGLTIMLCFGYLLWYSPFTALSVVISISFALAMFEFYYRTVLYGQLNECYELEEYLLGLVRHFFDGFKELKLNRAKSEDIYYNHLVPAADEFADLNIRIEKLFTNNSIAFSAVFFALLASVVFVFASYYSPQEILKISTVVVFLWTPLQTLDISVHFIAQSFVAMDKNTRLEERLRFKEAIGEHTHMPGSDVIQSFRGIVLEDVCFTHTDREGDRVFTVGPVSMEIRPGEVLFIMGGNGTGKSTLMKAICGLYPLEAGTASIDERIVDLAEHRHLFAAVFSDFHLFERLYGVDDLDENKVNALLDLMKLKDSTAWRENGFTRTDLSTGQRKRLALICALLEDKPVLLFDEWAAEQSPGFRRYFYEELLPELRNGGKAVVAITHDDQFTHVADKIIVLER